MTAAKTTPKIDLSALSIEELENLRTQIEKALERRRSESLEQAFAKLEETAAKLGIDKAQLASRYAGGVRQRRSSAKPVERKYRNPADPSQTWTGRGRKPVWVRSHLEAGGKIEELRI